MASGDDRRRAKVALCKQAQDAGSPPSLPCTKALAMLAQVPPPYCLSCPAPGEVSDFLIDAVLLDGLKGRQTSIEILSPKTRIDGKGHDSLDLGDPRLEVHALAPGPRPIGCQSLSRRR